MDPEYIGVLACDVSNLVDAWLDDVYTRSVNRRVSRFLRVFLSKSVPRHTADLQPVSIGLSIFRNF